MFKPVTLFLAFFVTIFPQASWAQANYNLSPDDVQMIQRGYRQYQAGEYSGQYADGKYTDPNADTIVYDFWTNGIFAKYDRDHDGHHETILEIVNRQIFYIGTLGGDGKFVHVGKKHPEYLHRSITDYVRSLYK
jgi:hypothetical protein